MDHASCDKCGKFCNEVAYECATCNSNIQVQGRGGAKGGREGAAAPPDLPQNLYIIV